MLCTLQCSICGCDTTAEETRLEGHTLVCAKCTSYWANGYFLIKCTKCESWSAYPVHFHEEFLEKISSKEMLQNVWYTEQGFVLLLLNYCPNCHNHHSGNNLTN